MTKDRTKLEDIRLHVGMRGAEAEVVLSRMGVQITGEEKSAGGREIDVLRCVANATSKAIAQFYHDLILIVDDVKEFPIADKKVIVVVVTVTFPDRDMDLTSAGSSLVKVGPHRACAEATLDAVNRLISKYEVDVNLED